MKTKDNGSLAKLLALKLVCCGGLLLVVGGVSIGSITAVLGNGWVQGAGIVLIAAGAARYAWVRRNRRQGTADLRSSAADVAGE